MSPEVVRNLGWDLISGSAHAAVLGLLVLSVRSLLRRHLSPDWRMALGSLTGMMAHYVESRKLSKSQLSELRKLLESESGK